MCSRSISARAFQQGLKLANDGGRFWMLGLIRDGNGTK